MSAVPRMMTRPDTASPLAGWVISLATRRLRVGVGVGGTCPGSSVAVGEGVHVGVGWSELFCALNLCSSGGVQNRPSATAMTVTAMRPSRTRLICTDMPEFHHKRVDLGGHGPTNVDRG